MKLFDKIKSFFGNDGNDGVTTYKNLLFSNTKPVPTYQIGTVIDNGSNDKGASVAFGLLNPMFVVENQIVDFRIIPTKEYEVYSVSVRNSFNGNKIDFIPTYECNNEYTFKMPACNVSINVKLTKKGKIYGK